MSYSCTRSLNIIKISVLSKLIQHNPNQNLNRIFVPIDKLIIKFIHKSKGPRIPKMILERRTKSGNKYSLISRLTLNYGNLKTVWCCHKWANKSMGQNRDRAPSRATMKRALAVRHGGMTQVQLKHLHIPPPPPTSMSLSTQRPRAVTQLLPAFCI